MLILPVLIPSWRFFKTIEPSPRVQWALVPAADNGAREWHEFRPRPLHITPFEMMWRLFWNPARNDALFVVSCAERIAEHPTRHSIDEINRRILSEVAHSQTDLMGRLLQFRLVFVSRTDAGISEEIVYVSDPIAALAGAPQ